VINKNPAVSPIRSSNTWGCKVKLPDKSRFSVSLRVPHPGNVRQAQDRAAELQREVDARKIESSALWLGEKAVETLKLKLGLKPMEREDEIRPICGDPTSWWEARSAWLMSYPARKVVEGKVHDQDLTKRGYAAKTKLFCEWAEEAGVKWKGKSATTVTLLYLKARKAGGSAASKSGVSLGTLDGDVRVLHTWFSWLFRRGWYNRIDKDALYDDAVFAGDDDAGENFIPDPKLDLMTLTRMHERRFQGDQEWAAWRLYVLVRGLGCRPKEAYTLSWDTVQIDEGLVTFRDVKEEKLKTGRRGRGASRRSVRDRKVPIMFQWVQDALVEIKSLGAKRGTAVAVNTAGDYHRGSGQAANSFGRCLRDIGLYRKGYGLKACQRAAIVHLEQVLPPWVVARIAGHSLTIHMNRYSTNESHLPTSEDRDYGKFDRLSEAGRMMAEKHRQPTLLKRAMDEGEL
jgi:integrase